MNRPKLVLIADASAASAVRLGEQVARGSAYDTVSACDDQEALDQAQRRLPDAAIVDMDVDALDGLKAARRLRERYGEQRPLLIAITGGDSAEFDFSGLFDHVLRKPVDMAELMPKLEQC